MSGASEISLSYDEGKTSLLRSTSSAANNSLRKQLVSFHLVLFHPTIFLTDALPS